MADEILTVIGICLIVATFLITQILITAEQIEQAEAAKKLCDSELLLASEMKTTQLVPFEKLENCQNTTSFLLMLKLSPILYLVGLVMILFGVVSHIRK